MASLDAVDLGLLSPNDRASLVIHNLPHLTSKDLDTSLEDNCPICLVPLTTILAEADLREDERSDTGITKLMSCGHIFCRRDLAAWIRSLHGSCPTCRHVFLDVRPHNDSDDESSDGGEYVPDDDYRDDTDGFSDFDMELEMDMEMDEIWADGDDEYEDEVAEDGECDEVDESGGEYDDEDEDDDMDADLGLSEGDTSSEVEPGYPLDDISTDEIPITVAGEDTSIHSDNAPDDEQK